MKIVHYTVVDSVVYGLIVFLLFQTSLVYQLVVYLILFSLFQVVVTFGKYNIYCLIDIFFYEFNQFVNGSYSRHINSNMFPCSIKFYCI